MVISFLFFSFIFLFFSSNNPQRKGETWPSHYYKDIANRPATINSLKALLVLISFQHFPMRQLPFLLALRLNIRATIP